MSKRYRTIVADPPWDHSDGTGVNLHDGGRRTGLSYPTMSVKEIASLPVAGIAEADRWHVDGNRGGCNLFLWTTSRYLYDAHDVARAWRFTPTGVLVWCKPPRGFGMGGTFKNNVEFVLMARRGSPPRATGSSSTRWFAWPRSSHSTKPEAFFDLVESVSHPPYAELFARRARFGWEYPIGDQALGGVAA